MSAAHPDEPTPKRFRLVKVAVQAHFVLDDGEHLAEQVAYPVEIAAKDWDLYAREGFAASVEALQAQLDGQG